MLQLKELKSLPTNKLVDSERVRSAASRDLLGLSFGARLAIAGFGGHNRNRKTLSVASLVTTSQKGPSLSERPVQVQQRLRPRLSKGVGLNTRLAPANRGPRDLLGLVSSRNEPDGGQCQPVLQRAHIARLHSPVRPKIITKSILLFISSQLQLAKIQSAQV